MLKVNTNVLLAGVSTAEDVSVRIVSPHQCWREHRQNAVILRERWSSAGRLGLVQDSCLNIAWPLVTQTPALLWEDIGVNASLLNN